MSISIVWLECLDSDRPVVDCAVALICHLDQDVLGPLASITICPRPDRAFSSAAVSTAISGWRPMEPDPLGSLLVKARTIETLLSTYYNEFVYFCLYRIRRPYTAKQRYRSPTADPRSYLVCALLK